MDTRRKKKVAIFGAGVGGLTVAHELSEREGFDITIYEKEKVCGGKAISYVNASGLPVEHSARILPIDYSQLRDTLKRIPFEGGTLFNNIICPPAGSRRFFFFKDREPVTMPTYLPYTLRGFKEYWAFKKLIFSEIPMKEFGWLMFKLLKTMCMCDERRKAILEPLSWYEFLDGDHRSEGFKKLILRMPEFYLAARGTSSARSLAQLMVQYIFLPLIYPIETQKCVGHFLNGPVSDRMINPWVDYLKTRGVRIRVQCQAEKIHLQKNEVENVMIKNKEGKTEEINAGIYVFALPIERMQALVDKEVKNDVPSLAHLDKLKMVLTSGIQFFNANPDDSRFPQSWTLYLDSPWSIMGMYWSKELWPHTDFPPPVEGILSLAWSNFDAPGIVYHKPARQCTREEIKEEILAQLGMHQGAQDMLDALQIHDYYVDEKIEIDPQKGEMVKHHAPLFSPFPNTLQYQPTAATEINNLYVATDYVRTSFDITTMEAANEGGRRAVNAILARYSPHSKKCFVINSLKSGMGVFQFMDKIIYKIQLLWRKK